MKPIEIIKRELEKRESKIKNLRILISEDNWIVVNITHYERKPIMAGTPSNDVKIRIQPLVSGAYGFSEIDGRIDSHTNKSLHQHSGLSFFPIGSQTVSGALGTFLGYDCWEGIK